MEKPKQELQGVTKDKDIGFLSFLPLVVFLVVYMGSGLFFSAMGVEKPYTQIPRNFALLLGVVVALLMGERKLADKVNRFAEAAASQESW